METRGVFFFRPEVGGGRPRFARPPLQEARGPRLAPRGGRWVSFWRFNSRPYALLVLGSVHFERKNAVLQQKKAVFRL